MIYTPKIHRAIRFSIKTHEVYQKQKRKGKDIAYITHPLTVGIILSRAGAEEDVVVAGILHDTIEDSIPDKKVTRDMLAERFGKKVADIVYSVSEKDKSLSWDTRKEEARKEIAGFDHDSLLVKSADVISNVSEVLDDYARHGDLIFQRFNAPKEKVIEHNKKVIEIIMRSWKENPLSGDLQFLAKKLQAINGKPAE